MPVVSQIESHKRQKGSKGSIQGPFMCYHSDLGYNRGTLLFGLPGYSKILGDCYGGWTGKRTSSSLLQEVR